MGNRSVTDELKELLRPFVREHPLKKDTVLEEDVESLLGFAQAFHVEERLLETVKSNPDGVFWDFLKVIPQGVPPGQEELLLDDEEEEAGGWKKH